MRRGGAGGRDGRRAWGGWCVSGRAPSISLARSLLWPFPKAGGRGCTHKEKGDKRPPWHVIGTWSRQEVTETNAWGVGSCLRPASGHSNPREAPRPPPRNGILSSLRQLELRSHCRRRRRHRIPDARREHARQHPPVTIHGTEAVALSRAGAEGGVGAQHSPLNPRPEGHRRAPLHTTSAGN